MRRRATRGIAILSLQTLVSKGLVLIANLVLAHLLDPRAFGVVAFGSALVGVALVLANGGIGLGLVRNPKRPDKADLATMFGFTLAVAILLMAITVGVGLTLGQVGRVTALIALTLPLSTFCAPGAIVMERRLDYGSVTLIEWLATVAYVAWAIVSVLLGAGVWGLASAMVVRSLVRAAVTLVWVPKGRVWPRLQFHRLRPMLRFGSLSQASSLVDALRAQALNTGTTAIVGLPTLGLWTMASNISQGPFALYGILGRVAFPTIARLIEAGSDPAAELEGAMQTVAVPMGLLGVGIAATAPALVPLLLGTQWLGVIPALPWVAAALLVNAPVNVVLGGYLLARGKAGIVLVANVVEVAVGVAVTLPLLPLLGVQALGIGLLVGAVLDIPIFAHAMRRWGRVRAGLPIVPQVTAAVGATMAGWYVAAMLGGTVGGLLASGALAGAIYLALLAITSRPSLLRCGRYSLQAIGRRGAVGTT
ncbi:MAG: oligosaccharide flippase family protein [Acidimicrobiales bacterium]